MISAIVAVDENYGIGSNNKLLAHIPEDLKMFKELTTNNVIIMGRKTYDSLPNKPLPDRCNIVITSKVNGLYEEDDVIYSNMDWIKNALCNKKIFDFDDDTEIYIIGGGIIYKELLPYCERVYLTKILHSYENVDTYFPNIDKMSEWKLTSESEIKKHKGVKYKFCVYDKI